MFKFVSADFLFWLLLILSWVAVIVLLVLLNMKLRKWTDTPAPPEEVKANSTTAEIEIPPFARRRRHTDK